MDFRKKWKKHALIGVFLVGLGINFIAEATIIKGSGPEGWVLGHMALWFWTGLFGLAALNAGICFIADAIKNRIYFEMESGTSGLKNSG